MSTNKLLSTSLFCLHFYVIVDKLIKLEPIQFFIISCFALFYATFHSIVYIFSTSTWEVFFIFLAIFFTFLPLMFSFNFIILITYLKTYLNIIGVFFLRFNIIIHQFFCFINHRCCQHTIFTSLIF